MKFDGFYGNERVKEYLSCAFEKKSFPHALLIAGERGIGKKTLADIIARALICDSDDVPCDVCNSCKKALHGFHPDIIKLGFEDSSVKVSEMRELKRDALIRPNDAERKVYIINNAASMTHEAQDAFLKILEEPPAFTFFILLCSNYSDLLPTIVSRTAHITLCPLSDEDMSYIIKKKLPNLSRSEAEKLIESSGGICSFLSYDEDSDSAKFASLISEALLSHDELKIFKSLYSLDRQDRNTLFSVLDELTLILRDSIIILSSADSRLLSSPSSDISTRLAGEFSLSECLNFINHISDAKISCTKNVGVAHITGKLTCEFSYIAAK